MSPQRFWLLAGLAVAFVAFMALINFTAHYLLCGIAALLTVSAYLVGSFKLPIIRVVAIGVWSMSFGMTLNYIAIYMNNDAMPSYGPPAVGALPYRYVPIDQTTRLWFLCDIVPVQFHRTVLHNLLAITCYSYCSPGDLIYLLSIALLVALVGYAIVTGLDKGLGRLMGTS